MLLRGEVSGVEPSRHNQGIGLPGVMGDKHTVSSCPTHALSSQQQGKPSKHRRRSAHQSQDCGGKLAIVGQWRYHVSMIGCQSIILRSPMKSNGPGHSHRISTAAAAAVAVACMQDLDTLQSVFAAKPWRQGCLPLLQFMFSTRATTATPQPATLSGAACA
jgi:hypothetical protein